VLAHRGLRRLAERLVNDQPPMPDLAPEV